MDGGSEKESACTMLQLKTHQLVIAHRKTLAHHASTVLPLDDGRILVAWFGGSQEHSDDVGIYLAERDGHGFSEPRLMAAAMEPHWNPVLFQCGDRRIQLFYKRGREICDWRTFVRESADLGRTWGDPFELVPGDVSGGRGPVRNQPLRLKSGRIVAPASVERGIWRCFMDLSDDDGRTWRRSPMMEAPGTGCLEEQFVYWQRRMAQARQAGRPLGPEEVPAAFINGRGIIQPTLWEDEKGLHALMRSGEGWIYRADSADEGESWCEAYPTGIPNNNSGIDLTRLENGVLLLAYNPVSENFGQRTPVSIAASRDGGLTWAHQCDLDAGPGEFSYPAIVSRGRHIWLTYTYKRENIAYWEFDWLD